MANPAKPAPFWIRIRPYDPRKNALARSFTYRNVKYTEEAGWIPVSEALANELAKVRLDSRKPGSPLVFEAMSRAEAQARQDAEDAKVQRRARPAAEVLPVIEEETEEEAADEPPPPPPPRRAPPAAAPRLGRSVVPREEPAEDVEAAAEVEADEAPPAPPPRRRRAAPSQP